MDVDGLKLLIRDVPDFPKVGILFKDITPLLADGEALGKAAEAMADPFRNEGVTHVCGAEARGFIFASLVARELEAGLVPVRKAGKLPYKTHSETYALEYGTDTLEVHQDAVGPGDKVLMVDDLLATGGTMAACCRMIQALGAEVVGCSFLIELEFLPGREALSGYRIETVMAF